MPYLHWETDRQRDKFAIEIENITENWKKEKKKMEEQRKEKRRKHRNDLPKVVFKPWPAEGGKETTKKKDSVSSQSSRENGQKPVKTPSRNGIDVKFHSTNHDQRSTSRPKWVWPWSKDKSARRPKVERHESRINSIPTLIKTLGFGIKKGLPVIDGRVISPNPLGQFLIDAARLYEEMANYRDKKLLQKYLHSE
jgi:hypothetical protein